MYAWMYVCLCVSLMSWGPYEGQQTEFCLCEFPTKTLLLRELYVLEKPSVQFASQLTKQVLY